MKNNIFQTVLVGAFVVLLLGGFAAFALFRSSTDSENVIGNVVIWGTVDGSVMKNALESLDTLLPKNYSGNISYLQKDESTFNEDLVDALASGAGPDIFLIDHSDLLKQENKIYKIPFERYPERNFRNLFIEGAEIFTTNDGILAFPFILDPLVMYWNRDILSREGIALTPQYWDEFFVLSPKLTKRDQNASIQLSTVPFGEARNVTNAKEIISALILQTDTKIVETLTDGTRQVTLGRGESDDTNSVNSALRFYTEFSNPIKSVYSWNRALPQSQRAFLSEDLVFYFGFASELDDLRKANPNLNFDIAVLPQIRDDKTPTTFANMKGIAITKSSKNIAGSLTVGSLLASNPVLSVLHDLNGLPPVSRQLLNDVPTDDIAQPIFYESAFISRGWLEPDGAKVTTIFTNMIESISSGRLIIREAVNEARVEIGNLLK